MKREIQVCGPFFAGDLGLRFRVSSDFHAIASVKRGSFLFDRIPSTEAAFVATVSGNNFWVWPLCLNSIHGESGGAFSR
jgi:hypothetical protein